MPKYTIKPEGSLDAELAMVCEKPAREESGWVNPDGSVGRLLIGRTGRMMRHHLRRAGIDAGRQVLDSKGYETEFTLAKGVWLTNAVQSFDDPSANPSPKDIIREQPRLFDELSNLPNLKCICAVGAWAFASLTNFTYGPGDLLARRGSVYNSILGIKMVPTLHAAFYVRDQWRYRQVVQFDVSKAVEESKFPEIRIPEQRFHIEPINIKEALEWCTAVKKGPYLSFDIEAFRTRPGWWYLRCISFANDPNEAYCIPLTDREHKSLWSIEEELILRNAIQEVLDDPHKVYVTQNGLSDTRLLRKEAIVCPHMSKGMDSMYAHAYHMPGLPHDLGFLTSIHTPQRYYKDESGDWDEEAPPVPERQFQIYNCKDSANTLGAMINISREMLEVKSWDDYHDHDQAQWDAIQQMTDNGVHIDKIALKEIQDECRETINKYEAKMIETVGFVVNTRSSAEVAKVLRKFGVNVRYTQKGNPSTKEVNMLHYAHEAPKAREFIDACLNIQEQKTLLSNFLHMSLDANGFYHPQYRINGTSTGRLSSKGAPEGGPQWQNPPKRFRRVAIPDSPEHEFTQADLKQAESMTTAWNCNDTVLMDIFSKRMDAHQYKGCLMFYDWDSTKGIPPSNLMVEIKKQCDEPNCILCRSPNYAGEECTHSRRFISKTGGHACAYGMMESKYANELMAKIGRWIDLRQAKREIDRLKTPPIVAWQEDRMNQLRNNRFVWTNVLGRRRRFFGIPDNKLLRDLLAWESSSPVSGITGRAMIFAQKHLPPGARVVTNTHDSLLVSNLKKDRELVKEVLHEAFDTVLNYNGRLLRIPEEFSHGPNWGQLK